MGYGARMRTAFVLFAASTLAISAPALAQDLRDFCPDRPGLDTPPCTVDPGHTIVEVGAVDWTLDKDSEARTDTITAGDLLIRYGVADHAEVRFGWTVFGTQRTRDRASGAVSRESGTGDVELGLRRNLSNPDGSGFSVALMPFATLPTGGHAIGAGDWGAGLVAPLSYDLGHGVKATLTPEIEAAVDEDRHGRHLAYGSVAGVGIDLSKSVTGTLEVEALRDQDPAGHATEAMASASIAWQPTDDLQFDAGVVAGLNNDSPDAELYLGVARRF
jgi:hypothetical protein